MDRDIPTHSPRSCGCKIANCCLECPLAVCIYDMPKTEAERIILDITRLEANALRRAQKHEKRTQTIDAHQRTTSLTRSTPRQRTRSQTKPPGRVLTNMYRNALLNVRSQPAIIETRS